MPGTSLPKTSSTPHEFVLSHTAPHPVAFVPELQLHQAQDAFTLWEATEARQARAAVAAPPFWAFAWAGGLALARYLLDHPRVAAGQRVLDLAAGSGLVAIAAARSGASQVRATEIDEYAVAAIELNAELNAVSVHADLADVLDGRDTGAPSLVLVGDGFYSAEMARRILAYLRRCQATGAEVLVGDPGRAYLPTSGVEPVIRHEVPVLRTLEDADTKTVTVWRLLP